MPERYESIAFGTFVALPGLSADYTDAEWDVVRVQSGRAVSLDGYIAEVQQSRDGMSYGRWPWNGDLHVHVQDELQSGGGPGGAPTPQIVTEVTPLFQPPKTGWSLAALRDLSERRVRVRISGWLLHDYHHLGGGGGRRASAWEIHPITKIEVWEADRQVWWPLP